MAGYDGRGARFDIVAVAGNDLSFTVTAVDSDSVAVNLSAATVTATIYDKTDTALDTFTDVVGGAGSNVITLSLTDTEVDALTAPTSWALVVTRSGDARTWLAGKFTVADADRARNSTSGTSVTATVDTNVTITASVTTAAIAANVAITDTAGNYTATTVEGALAELPSQYAARRNTPPQGAGLLCVTVDDAYADMLTVASILEARNGRGTFCITTDYLGGSGKITSADVTALDAAGHEIAAHGKTHTNLTSLTASERATEWDTPKTVLDALISGEVTTWCYPYGSAGRNATTDQEGYTRYPRLLDTGAQTISMVHPRYQPPPFLIQRSLLETGDVVEDWTAVIRRLAYTPSIAVMFFHQFGTANNPTLSEFTTLMDLAESLGVRCCTVSDAFGSPVLLSNPSFEDDAASFRPWYPITSGGGTVAMSDGITPDSGISGSRALRLTVPAGTASAYVRQVVPVEPGQVYTLSYRAKVISGTIAQANDAYGRIQGLDYAQTASGASVVTAAPTAGTWAKKSIDYTVPSDVKSVRVELVVTDVATGATVDFDHVWFGLKCHGDNG